MKLLRNILGLLTLAFQSFVGAQTSTSAPIGFHSELVKANSFSLLGVNVTNNVNEPHHRSIEEMFGPNNETGLNAGKPAEADIVWLPDLEHGYVKIYYNDKLQTFPPITVGWRGVGFGNADMSQFESPSNRGFFIESKKDYDWYIAFGGYIKQTEMFYDVEPGMNILNKGFPTNIQLNQSGIEQSEGFEHGDQNTGDIIWLYRTNGMYDRYYYSDGQSFPPLSPGWKLIGGGDEDVGHHILSSSFIVETKGGGGEIMLHPPPGFIRSKGATDPLAPPRANIYWSILEDVNGIPNFVMWWDSLGGNIIYTTEVYNGSSWMFISEQRNLPGQVLSNYATLGMGWGVARVVAEYSSF